MIHTYARTEHNIAHVTPVDDEIAHDLHDFRCICGPRVEYVEDGWVVVHQALDGRA